MPDETWPEVREYRYWDILRPKKNYYKSLGSQIKEKYPEADDHCVDLLEKLLCYNPEHRVSAKVALEHPFFISEPLPCKPREIRQMDKEYHDCLINEKNYKAQQELQNWMLEKETREKGDYPKKEYERQKSKEFESKKNNNTRLQSLFGVMGKGKKVEVETFNVAKTEKGKVEERKLEKSSSRPEVDQQNISDRDRLGIVADQS